MHDQPKYQPLEREPSSPTSAPRGRWSPGTVARGAPRRGPALLHRHDRRRAGARPTRSPVTRDVLLRGQERYDIYCSPCHDRVGNGDGMIVQRGYKQPPSFHSDRLRERARRLFFDVITNGFGAMPTYAPQVRARDRWAIVAYIRALQLSQNADAGRRAAPERADAREETPMSDADATRASSLQPDHVLHRSQRALLVAGVARRSSPPLPARWSSPAQFFRSYLVATCSGSASRSARSALVMLHHVTGGRWGVVIRRLSRRRRARCRCCAALPAAAARRRPTSTSGRGPEVVAHDALLQHKSALPQRAVLPRPRGALLRRLARRWRAS